MEEYIENGAIPGWHIDRVKGIHQRLSTAIADFPEEGDRPGRP